MDADERVVDGVPRSVEDIDTRGTSDASELWLLARAYSRLRHRSRSSNERQGWASLKHYCVRAAITRAPRLFVVAIDPSMPSFRFVYHRAERNLLHIPTSVEMEGSPLAGR
jgi:hypothetical protein